MPLTQEHELHRRRFGRNLGLGLVLAAFVALVFLLTLVKLDELMTATEIRHQVN